MHHAVFEFFVWVLGLCVGSFLNVVIYRLPAGLSISTPRWSFCPLCKSQLAWHDNVPVFAWLWLRGRCRSCQAPISVQYPLVEALTGLAFVVVYHLLFVETARAGLPVRLLAIDGLGPSDAVYLVAWLVFISVMIACSAMDITSYTIDIRLTDFATIVGVLAFACWPRAEFVLPTAQTPGAAACVVAFVISAAMLLWGNRESSESEPPAAPAAVRASGLAATGLAILVTLALIAADQLPRYSSEIRTSHALIGVAFLLFFLGTLFAASMQRPVDEELVATIEAERPHARREIGRELLWLTPALLAGIVTYLAFPSLESAWQGLVCWSPGGGLVPFAGAAFAMHGAIMGATAGWVLRIVFTLVFGREAFGTGDIYMLAAAGACTGADIALLGLGLAVAVALIGWMLGLLMKNAVMIPFGPWLAIGFFLALWVNRPALRIIGVYRANFAEAWEAEPSVIYVMGGLMLVGSVLAVALAKLARRMLEGPSSANGDRDVSSRS